MKDDEKTVRLDEEEKLQIAGVRIQTLKKQLAEARQRIAELEAELKYYTTDEETLAQRCRSLEEINMNLLARNRDLEKRLREKPGRRRR